MDSMLLHQALVENQIVVRRLNVHQLHQMLALGLIPEGEPVELMDGVLINKNRCDTGGEPMSHGPRHAVATEKLWELNQRIRGMGYVLRTQKPITLDEFFEPEPDGVIVLGPSSRFSDHHPLPADVAVVIEVADSSLKYDREAKQSIYAQARLPIYWLINLKENVVEVYFEPLATEGRYAGVEIYHPGMQLTVELSGSTLSVDPAELLP